MEMDESLFSLELHVENISRLKVSCSIPAVSFRLLDFPTLIVHHVSPANIQKLREKSQIQGITKEAIEAEFRDRHGNISFSKGKSCLFRSNVKNLKSQLQVTPMYLMLLDVWHKKPILVGSTIIPLKKTIDKIAADVERTGISVPSINQQEGKYEIYNLMGTVVGSIKLSLRLLSLGGCLTAHIPEKSIMKSVKKMEQEESMDKENHNVILEDLEVIDEELNTKHLSPTLENAQTQTYKQAPKSNKPVIHTNPSYTEDVESEPVIIANTICPPPLYYHVTSHVENSAEKIDKRITRENKVSGRSRINSQDVDFVYYKPDLLQPDGSCECKSISVQTDSSHTLPIAADKPIESTNMDHEKDLPLLTALLEELSFLRTKRKDAKLSAPNKLTPQPREPRVRECCSKVMDKKSAGELKNLKSKPSVLKQKRVKFKQTNLKYGMTKTQLMRLEMNQKARQTSRREVSHESKAQPSQELTQQEKKSCDLGRTHTLFDGSFATEEYSKVTTETDKLSKAGINSTRFSEFVKDCEDPMRPDSVDSSSRCLSSPNSVEIFLPQTEGESDNDGSDVFDITAPDADDRFAPHLTYNKYGHTGIQDIPEHTNQNTGQSSTPRKIPDQSELMVDSLDQPISRKNSYQSGLPKKKLDQSQLTMDGVDQSNLSKSDQLDSPKNSTNESGAVKSFPVSPPSPRKTPDLTERRSITSQTAKSRTSTALSMYSDDFEECPVWETPNPSGHDSSSSISCSSYHSLEAKDSGALGKDDYEPTKSSSGSEEGSPSPYNQDEDSLRKELYNQKESKDKNVLQLPKPANEMGYTF